MPMAFLDRWYLSLFGPVLITIAAALIYLLPWLITTQYYFRAKHFVNRMWLWLTDERTGPLRPARMGAIARARAAAAERLAIAKKRAQEAVLESETAKRARAAAKVAAEAAAAKIKESKALSSLATTAAGAAAAAEKETVVKDFDADDSDPDDMQTSRHAPGIGSPGVKPIAPHSRDRVDSIADQSDASDSESASYSQSGSHSSSRSQPETDSETESLPKEEGPGKSAESQPAIGSEESTNLNSENRQIDRVQSSETTGPTVEASTGTEVLIHGSVASSADGPTGGSAAADRPVGPGKAVEEIDEQEKELMKAGPEDDNIAAAPAKIGAVDHHYETGIPDAKEKIRGHRKLHRHHRRNKSGRRNRNKVAFEGGDAENDGGDVNSMPMTDGRVNDNLSRAKPERKPQGGRWGRGKRRQTTWGAAAAHFRRECLDSAVQWITKPYTKQCILCKLLYSLIHNLF
jgi:hypothetical protein